ncbi:MAG TPA: alanyl-tRNA editing protein [Bryobacteraceae bacterium]|jgi:alanyl-tRNA synthetase|nr:alanyl-tRNA editing protein [Bryobacteraceae bacterium]
MTERLYYHDSYLHTFAAQALECSPDGNIVYLDRTAFYPTSGGQPFDLGAVSGIAIRDVVDEGDRIAHVLAAPLAPGPVECSIDWTRRFDHMQQHTGQHLISAVFEEMFSLRTVSFHLGADSATIDLEGGTADARALAAAEARANEVVWENRPVAVTYEDAAAVQGLRKASEREGTLRIVSIDRLDRSACGGTHVRTTGEIGAVLLRKLEKVRQTVRVEFLCGGRAIRRARADYEALTRVAQLFSSSLDEAPGVVAAQMEAARTADKARRKLELDLAAYQGRELYQNTVPGPDGVRRAVRRAASGSLDELRALAQNFTAQSQAIFVATLAAPPSVLLATSADSGVDAGQKLKAALAAAGGRGGGTPRMAQGSVPDSAALDKLAGDLSEK